MHAGDEPISPATLAARVCRMRRRMENACITRGARKRVHDASPHFNRVPLGATHKRVFFVLSRASAAPPAGDFSRRDRGKLRVKCFELFERC